MRWSPAVTALWSGCVGDVLNQRMLTVGNNPKSSNDTKQWGLD